MTGASWLSPTSFAPSSLFGTCASGPGSRPNRASRGETAAARSQPGRAGTRRRDRQRSRRDRPSRPLAAWLWHKPGRDRSRQPVRLVACWRPPGRLRRHRSSDRLRDGDRSAEYGLDGMAGTVRAVGFAGPGRLLTGDDRGTVTLWDTRIFREVLSLRDLTGPVDFLALLGDRAVLGASLDGSTRRWEVGAAAGRFGDRDDPLTTLAEEVQR